MITHKLKNRFSSFDATGQRTALPLTNDGEVTDHLLCKRELAAALRVSIRSVEKWASERKIPYLRLSPRLTRFDLQKVLAALARYEVREIGGGR
jgi:hypothetical protein